MSIKLYNDNCMNVMKDIESDSVDLIVTDPPYKITSRGATGTMGGYWTNDKTKQGDIFNNNNINCSEYLPEFYRILKDKSICYVMCNHVNLQEMINVGTSVGFNFVKCLIWKKGNMKICGTYYMGCFEYILLFRKGGDRPINDCSTPDILDIPIHKQKDSDGNNLHDTEKPVELMNILVRNSSNENDIVLDPFMGIGATGVSCKNLNRRFIGIEIDSNYFNIAKSRIDSTHTTEQCSLF